MGQRPIGGLGAGFLLGVTLFSGCGSEAEQRARGMGELRHAAVEGLDAANRYCDARDSAVAAFNRGEPGWEQTLEEVLRGPFALDDYCEEGRGPHEHDEAAPDTAVARDSSIVP